MASGRATPTSPRQSTLQPQMESNAVRVALRIRPPSDNDAAPARYQRTVIAPLSPQALQVEASQTVPGQPPRPTKQAYTFDRVFAATEDQPAVWTTVEDLISKFLQGYNVTVLSYGQTSSGKSYTMGTDMVDPSSPDVDGDRLGIVPRAVRTIFDYLAQQQDAKTSYTVKNSYLEVYNDDLIDLLHLGPGERPPIAIREEKNGTILCTGLTEEVVYNAEQVMNNLYAGSATRQTGSTDMNAQSSRSHAIFSLALTQTRGSSHGPARPASRASRLPGARNSTIGGRPGTPLGQERPSSRLGGAKSPLSPSGRATPGPNAIEEEGEVVTIHSKLNLVDLAGSERLKRTSAVGERVKEGISINAGLHALGNVISALASSSRMRPTHVPYRDSKLTRLLQDSLGGNAYTLMIACISPTEFNVSESINTLHFASRAKNIKNVATINEFEEGWEDVNHLQKLVLQLRGELTYKNSIEGVLSAPALPNHLAIEQQESLQRTSRGSLTPQDFATAVEPVVEEYERSLSALESQLSITRSALSFTESALKELEDNSAAEKEERQSLLTATEQLNAMVAKLKEREESSDRYIADLENKIKTLSDATDTHTTQASDVRKDLVRSKEALKSAESYISSLEQQLAQLAASADNKSRRVSIEAATPPAEVPAETPPTAIDQHAVTTFQTLLSELDARAVDLRNMQEALLQAQQEVASLKGAEPATPAEAEASLDNSRHLILQIQELKAKLEQQAQSTPEPQEKRAPSPQNEDAMVELVALKEENEALLRRLRDLENQPNSSPLKMRFNSLSIVPESRVDHLRISPTIPLSPGRSRHSLSAEPRSFLDRTPSPVQADSGYPFSSSPPSSLAASLPGMRLNRRVSSPTFSLREFGRGDPTAGRTHNSFTKEITQLQKVLSDREAEIAALEQKLSAALEEGNDSGGNRTSVPSPSDSDPMEPEDDLKADRTAEEDSSPMSPSTRTILTSLEDEWTQAAETRSQQQILMSMARKEAAYKAQIEQLEESLVALQREKQTAETLARDQLSLTSEETSRLNEQLALCRQELDAVKSQYIVAQREVSSHATQLESHTQQAQELQGFMQEIEQEHRKEIQRLTDERDAHNAEFQAEHQKRLQDLQQDFETKEEGLRLELARVREELNSTRAHAEAVQKTLSSHDDHQAASVVALDELQQKLSGQMRDLQTEHADQLSKLKEEKSSALANLENTLRQEIGTLLAQQEAANAQVKDLAKSKDALASQINQHEQQKRSVEEENSVHKSKLEELTAHVEQIRSQAEEERSNAALLAAELAKLDASLLQANKEKDAAHAGLRQAMQQSEATSKQAKELQAAVDELTKAKAAYATQEEELREALDALGTLERALLESTDEKETMRLQLVELEQRPARPDVADLQKIVQQQKTALAQLQQQLLHAQRSADERGMASEILRTPTLPPMTSGEDALRAGTPPSQSPTTRLSTGKLNSTALPPPRPPPSSSLPPLPVGVEEEPSSLDPRASVMSTASRMSDVGTVRGSTMSSTTSESTHQEALITKLTQQLAHCEKDLKANLDLVQMLEGALGETERSLRKTKVQISSVAQERDAANAANDVLKQQMHSLRSEIDGLRQSRNSEQTRWEQEQRQKDMARADLQNRLDNLKQRKSKLNCF